MRSPSITIRLIAKLIVWAEDRPAATAPHAAALRETVLLGLTNNGQFLQDVLAAPDFQRRRSLHHLGGGARLATGSRRSARCRLKCWSPPRWQASNLAPAHLIRVASRDAPGRDPYSPWRAANHFRIGESR